MPEGMTNPFRETPQKKSPSSTMTPKELFRLYVMVGAFVLVIASMLAFYLFSQDDAKEKKDRNPEGAIKIRDGRPETRKPPTRADETNQDPGKKEPEPPPPGREAG